MEKFKLAKLVEKPSLDERWYVEYNYRHPETGKFKSPAYRQFISQKLKTKAGRRKRGYEIVNEINKKLREGWNPFQKHEVRFTPLHEAIDFALELKKAHLRKRSYQTYKNMIVTFQRFLEEKEYKMLASEDFGFQKALEFMDWAIITLSISNRTYNNYIKHMRTFFYTLQQRDYISFNPFSKVDLVQVEQPEIIMFSKEELAIIKNTLPEYDPGLFLCSQLIFYCTIRPQEICRLRFSNIDMVNRIIHMPGKISKNKMSEKVIIPNQLYEILLQYNLDRYPKHYHIVSSKLKPGPTEIAHTRISERWRKYADELKLDPRKTIYLLKHTVAAMLVKAGKDIRSIQLHLRHKNLEMTKIYLDRVANMPDSDMRDEYVDF